MTNDDSWFDLASGFCVSIGQGRTRRGIVPPPRFILLGPLPAGDRLRKTIASGAFLPTKPRPGTSVAIALDFGVLSPELERELCAAFEKWRFHRPWMRTREDQS